MTRFNPSAPPLAALVVLALAAAEPARAFEINAEVFHLAEYTTNTARTDTDEIEEWINAPGARISASQAGADLELNADYEFLRRLYEEDLFDDESVLTGSSEMVWHALPSRLDLTLRNTRSESTERAYEPFTQDNRQVVSITEVGPTLRLAPRSGDELQFEYFFSDVTSEDTDSDRIRHDSAVRYILGLSESRALTFSVDNNRVDFEEEDSADLDGWTGTTAISQTAEHLSYLLGVGYTSTSRTNDLDDVEGMVFSSSLESQMIANTRITLAASRQIRDDSENLYDDAVDTGGDLTENTELNEVFTEDLASIAITRTFGNNEITLGGYFTDQDYEDVASDNQRWIATLGLARNLTPRTRLTASIGSGRSEFDETEGEYDELRGSLLVDWRMSRRFHLTWGARYEERDGDDTTGNYEEWVGTARISYILLGAAPP